VTTTSPTGFFLRPGARSALAIAAPFLALALTALPAAEAASLTARGNEPGWRIELSEKAITFNGQDGEIFTIAPVPQAARTGTTDTYAATVDGRTFTLAIADAVCADTMTGMPHPKTVTVTIGNDRKLTGCGGEPASLLHGDWKVEEIEGKPIVPDSKPTLAFTPEGSINGNGSCNRFFGSFSLSGEGLKVSHIGATMMACEPPILSQEGTFFKTLEAVQRFEVAADGRLRLLGGDGRALIMLRR
jgi:heat shock protein HslJ